MALIRNFLLKWNRNTSLIEKFNLVRKAGMCDSASPIKCKVALITGASVGIGYQFAKYLLEYGARGVIMGDVRTQDGEKAANEFNKKYGENKAHFMQCDVTKEDQLKALFECALKKYKMLDIVINNAGLLQDKNWSLEVDVNVKGVIQGTLFGFEYMGTHKKGRGGVIVNVASIYGLQTAYPCPVYNGTKSFVVRFSNAMSHEYYESLTKVKVFTICPGVTNTQMIDDSGKYGLPGFDGIGKLVEEGLHDLPEQPAEACGECLMDILCADENGGIWVIEENECYKVQLPDRHSLRVCD